MKLAIVIFALCVYLGQAIAAPQDEAEGGPPPAEEGGPPPAEEGGPPPAEDGPAAPPPAAEGRTVEDGPPPESGKGRPPNPGPVDQQRHQYGGKMNGPVVQRPFTSDMNLPNIDSPYAEDIGECVKLCKTEEELWCGKHREEGYKKLFFTPCHWECYRQYYELHEARWCHDAVNDQDCCDDAPPLQKK